MSDWLVRQLFEEDRKRVEKGEVRNNETSKTIRINVCYECSFLLDDPNKELKSLNVLGNSCFFLYFLRTIVYNGIGLRLLRVSPP